jgi:hypothetical protein
MPGKSKSVPPEPVSAYPNIERFLELCERESPAKLFRETKKKLEELSGSKNAQAKKALSAIERVEGLLGELYEVRLRLEDQARQAKNTRR